MKGRQAISVTLLMSFLVLVTRGKDVRYRRQEEDNTHILTYRRVNKAIQMKDGDVYDCIDVNEQSAFNHPLLKDHKIQTAGITYKGDIYGTRVVLNVWEPKVNKGSKDSSAIWVEMKNGGGEHADKMGAGLRVSRTLSGDTFVRFHIAWYDGLYKKGCIDFSFPGFVQVDHKVALGSRIQPLSTYDGPQRIVDIQIFKDAVSKNWWVTLQNIPIGYWPSPLFEYLRNKGDLAFWGGFVAGPTASSNSPQMGSGHFASEGFGRAAYIGNIKIVDENNKYITPDESHVEDAFSDPSKYTVHRFEGSKDAGIGIYYGGPGSNKA